MSKKGFTLVEILGTLVILGIILAITVPAIGNVINNSYTKACEINLQSMEEGARAYVLKNNIKMEQGEAIRIDISQLEEEILTKPILDPQTKEKCTGYVTVFNNNDSYKFNPCLKCGENFMSDECNVDTTSPVITILGDNPVNIHAGQVYIDAGATALDDRDGDYNR